MLTSSEAQNQSRVAELERELADSSRSIRSFESELATKNEAITDLLEELTNKQSDRKIR